MDVEEFVRRLSAGGVPDPETEAQLADHIRRIKDVSPEYARAFAHAVVVEVKNTTGLSGDLFSFERSGISMGEFGVGSRGEGDFFAHRQFPLIIGKTGAEVSVDEMDDAGAVRGAEGYIVCTVDGMHSRLSDFPFLAGFHVTRATLRDVYVMGAKPVALLSDIHVADDGDVAKVFDYTAGIAVVSEAMGVPLVTGSTLRIGGDMVLGSRLTGCVAAVGTTGHLTARRSMRPGDVLLMTEGAGGGTIATAALYSGYPEVVERTINLHFLKAAEALLSRPEVLSGIHAMTDVTNGGLRGDAYEMAETAQCRIVVEDEPLRDLVDPEVLKLLDILEIDYLGVSIDALLVAAPPEMKDAIIRVVGEAGVRMEEIGRIEEGAPDSVLMVNGEPHDFRPKFRESAYTPVKKVVDTKCGDIEAMKQKVARSAEAAREKKERVLRRLRE